MIDRRHFMHFDWLTFSDPTLRDTIVLHNRSFYWANVDDPGTAAIESGLFPATCVGPPDGTDCDVATADVNDYSYDLAVIDADGVVSGLHDPRFSMLTDNALNAGYIGINDNIAGATGNEDFVNGYFNGARVSIDIAEGTTIQTAGAFDEGGNFLQVSFGPLSLLEPGQGAGNDPANNTTLLDYHLCLADDCTPASGGGQWRTSGNPNLQNPPPALLAEDFDNDTRPTGQYSDVGADEKQ